MHSLGDLLLSTQAMQLGNARHTYSEMSRPHCPAAIRRARPPDLRQCRSAGQHLHGIAISALHHFFLQFLLSPTTCLQAPQLLSTSTPTFVNTPLTFVYRPYSTLNGARSLHRCYIHLLQKSPFIAKILLFNTIYSIYYLSPFR